MTDFLAKETHLKEAIIHLTDNIAEQVEHNLFEEIDILLSQRHILITELMAMQITDEGRKALIHFLSEVRQKDQMILGALNVERDQLKNALSSVGKVKQYLAD